MPKYKPLVLTGLVFSLALAACSAPTGTPAPLSTAALATPAPLSTGVPAAASPLPPSPLPEGYPPATPEPPQPSATAESYPAATEASTEAPAATATPAATDTPAAVFITYNNFNILPAQTTIKVGTTVTFLIQDSVHQPYAGASAPFIFESPANLGPGTSWAHTFNQAGTFTILCGYHPNMSGTLIVQP